ncbi:hypothetical protein UPYG_G00307260 [Umbra pygmaea]|uniref:Uncharacterized protein n=1 Tax=Umbra pygmaea TaxID=75934 RepID=A0ABD0WII5_UMBPY
MVLAMDLLGKYSRLRFNPSQAIEATPLPPPPPPLHLSSDPASAAVTSLVGRVDRGGGCLCVCARSGFVFVRVRPPGCPFSLE